MLRTSPQRSWIKRTIRPLYNYTQATPKGMFLDPAFDRSVPIWPGMVVKRTLGDNVTLVDGADDVPYGLAALYVGGDGIDEVMWSGINAFTVWVLDRDAEFEILAPAFDTTQTWTDPGDGSEVLLYAGTGAAQGKLVPAGASGAGTEAVARLLKVNSPTKITIGGLR